jgi:ubiquinone/menaquinone biosynthesis C-methylase UbiE
MIAPELCGPVLDVGCGEVRLASLLGNAVAWIGVESSRRQLAACSYRPVVLADKRALLFRDESFAEVSHLWCLYHVEDPPVAIDEAQYALFPR